MNWKKYVFPVTLVLISVLAITFGIVGLNRIFDSQVNDERINQLEELTSQLSATLEDALDFNRACTGTAANLFTEQEYATKDDIVKAAERITEKVLTEEEEEEEERVFLLLDEDGVCYDKDGTKGIWGDFDQVVGIEDYGTFISDSVNYKGTNWAFVRKLDEPVETLDGKVSIQYVALLKTVDSMSGYYASKAYDYVCETYLLKSNGTRMYDSVADTDTIPSYNIYKNLRETESQYGGSFDETLEKLEDSKVACGNYESNGTEYCYSLAWLEDYDFVIMFLIPTKEVAANTLSMVTTMTRVMIFFCVFMVVLIVLAAVSLVRLSGSRKMSQLKEKNLKEIKAVNDSLMKANRAAESALDIAKSANRAKSSFLSNMSHDIRTPLNAIIGFLQLLEKDADDPEKVLGYSQKIRVSSQHLLNLINDILDMSRIESGKTTLNQKVFSMEEFVGNIETVIAPQAREKKQKFVVDAADIAGIVVEGDSLRLGQILMNLLSNAVKYTQEGGTIALTVRKLHTVSTQMVPLKFIVSDNGIGMSPEFQKRVFEPFEREQTSTNSGVQGTGLGMAITKNLVDLMGGIIMVDSIPGKGSAFTLELSLRLAGTKEIKKAAGGKLSGDSDGGGEAVQKGNILKGRHFLVAEDNDINAEIISELLAMEGAACDIAVNGKEALRMLETSKPGTYDAIFMDIQMPVMGGYESARKIRSCGHPDAAAIPIAAMTANAFAEDVQKALQAGMNAHIPKPVDMEKIREFIENELGEVK